ncbi:DUF4062 domain-containing protein [Pseudomonas alloputida]|uniref:DUF4062 domain-containing protein n=1 Tax=Pseudomonas alloputida TaxID=1940621 RepID=UPI00320A36AA
MAGLKVFISSTCYDLQSIRGQLRNLMMGLGHEPIMSDQAEVIFDPQTHTHTSCLREVRNSDVVILVIGSRFGGTIIPKALEQIELEKIIETSNAERFGENGGKISITQAEILNAIQHGIPVFAFVDSGIMRDHLTYEKNKNKAIIHEIEFSSIDKPETAAYIFEFINFLRLRHENNSIFEFSRFEDIESQLKKQWSGLFQRLLSEQRTKAFEGKNIDQLSSQIADLKAAVLGSISSTKLKDTAKGAIRFRTLIEFTHSLINETAPDKSEKLLSSKISWSELTSELGIVKSLQPEQGDRFGSRNTILIGEDNTYYEVKMPKARVDRIEEEWEDFKELGDEAKSAIINAVIDSRNGRAIQLVRHFNEPYIDASFSQINFTEIMGRMTFGEYVKAMTDRRALIEHSLKDFILKDDQLSALNITIDVQQNQTLLTSKSGEKINPSTIRFPIKLEEDPRSQIEHLKDIIKNVLAPNFAK